MRDSPVLPLASQPTLAVIRLSNVTGDNDRDFLATALAEAVTITLGSRTYFGEVSFANDYLSGGSANDTMVSATELGADLLLEGAFLVRAEGLSFEMTLLDGATGKAISTFQVVVEDNDFAAAGFAIAKGALAAAQSHTGWRTDEALDPGWGKVSASGDEYLIVLRSFAALYETAFAANDEAMRRIATGLERYPESYLLRINLAERYLQIGRNGPENERWDAVQKAWAIIKELPPEDRLELPEQWYLHLTRAQLTPLATGDFEAAMHEAEAAHALTPGLPWANLTLSDIAANAGHGDRAIEWAKVGRVKGRKPTFRHREALAWALLVAGKPEESLAEYAMIQDKCLPCEVVALVRTGRLDRARRLAEDIRKNRPYLTLSFERNFPTGRQPFMAEPHLTALPRRPAQSGAARNSPARSSPAAVTLTTPPAPAPGPR